MPFVKKSDRGANYAANSLNQYVSRICAGYMDGCLNDFGSANSNATVSLSSLGYSGQTTRHGEYYEGELALNNSTGALFLTITNLAILNDGTNADISTSLRGNLFVPKDPEQFTCDLDANLMSGGRFTNSWDAENLYVLRLARNVVEQMRTAWRIATVTIILFVCINTASFFARTDGHGITHTYDGTTRVGWPALIYERGGYVYHKRVYPVGVLLDLVSAAVFSASLVLCWTAVSFRQSPDDDPHPST